jgi:hypothetical protein
VKPVTTKSGLFSRTFAEFEKEFPPISSIDKVSARKSSAKRKLSERQRNDSDKEEKEEEEIVEEDEAKVLQECQIAVSSSIRPSLMEENDSQQEPPTKRIRLEKSGKVNSENASSLMRLVNKPLTSPF